MKFVTILIDICVDNISTIMYIMLIVLSYKILILIIKNIIKYSVNNYTNYSYKSIQHHRKILNKYYY